MLRRIAPRSSLVWAILAGCGGGGRATPTAGDGGADPQHASDGGTDARKAAPDAARDAPVDAPAAPDGPVDAGRDSTATDAAFDSIGPDGGWLVAPHDPLPQVTPYGGPVIASPVFTSITFPGYDLTVEANAIVRG
jgi:hypothetical protein